MGLVFGLCVTVVAFCGWVLACNFKTSRQIGRLLDECDPGSPDFRRKFNAVTAVKYERHLFTLVFLGNVKSLYPEELAKVLE